MKILLLQDIKKIGKKGEIVTVADGLAHNMLIPQKKAVPATDGVVENHARNKKKGDKNREEYAQKVSRQLQKIHGGIFRYPVSANEQGRLYHSLKDEDVLQAVGPLPGVNTKDIALSYDDPIKEVGTYKVSLSFNDSKAECTLDIISE